MNKITIMGIVMARKKGLTYKDEELVERLARAGLSKNVAKGLAFILKVKKASSKEIEKGAGLRQPEVSTAMQKLRSLGWVEKENLKRKGKGRPTHSYKLSVKPIWIAKKIEERELKKIREIKENALTLKKLIK